MSPIPTGANVGSASVSLTGDTSGFTAALHRASTQFQRFGRELEGKLQAFDKRMSSGFGALGSRMQSIGRTLSTHVTLPLVAAGAGALVAGVKMDTLRRALTAVAGSSGEAEQQMVRLKEIAKLPGIGLAEAVQGSVRLQAIGVSAQTAERSLKAFGNAIATTGGGRVELERITVQLGQLSAKGRILAQDLRPIIDAGPAVGKALKEAFGTVDAEEIQALGLTTEQFLDQLLTQLEKLPKVSGGAKNSFENLQTALLEAGDAIAKTFLPLVVQLANKLSGFLAKLQAVNPDTLQWGVALGAVAASMGPVVGILGALTVAVKAFATAIGVGLLPLIGVGGAVLIGLGLLAALFIKNTLAAAAAAAAVKSFADVLKSTSEVELGLKIIAEEEKLEALVAERKEKLSIAGFFDTSEIDRAIATTSLNIEALRDRVLELRAVAVTPGGAGAGAGLARGFGPIPPPGVLTRLLDGLEAARAKLAELRFEESAFARSTEDATKLGEEIATTTAQIRDMERALAAVDVTRAFGPVPAPAVVRGPVPGADIVPVGRDLKAIHEVFTPSPLKTAREDAFLLAQALQNVVTPLQAIGAQLQSIALSAADTFGDMTAALVQFAVEGEQKFGSLTDKLHDLFHNFVQSALRDLARLLARLALVKVFETLFPGPGSVISKGIGLAARGGPVRRGEPYIVGEEGPELMVPSVAGTIVPNHVLERVRSISRAIPTSLAASAVLAAGTPALAAGVQHESGGSSGSSNSLSLDAVSPFARIATSLAGAAQVAARASGGPVMRHHTYLVGERGPELFVPDARTAAVRGERAEGGGTIRIDLSNLPPIPPPMTPDAVSAHDWWRRAFSKLYYDFGERGGKK